MTSSADRQSLINEITQYLAECPHAKDSYDGILWWLTKQRYERVRPLIQSILDELVDQGVLQCRRQASNSPIYCLTEITKARSDADYVEPNKIDSAKRDTGTESPESSAEDS